MIQCFCDKCGMPIPIDKTKRVIEKVYACDSKGNRITGFPAVAHDLCEECHKKYALLNIEIQDFMAMSNKEIEFALYTFKVGDKVITADGRVGTITDICTCDKCKTRGFYEPIVKLESGLYDIYITDTDKNNRFMSFYQIGDKVFGNIDEKEAERIPREIVARKCEINCLEAQLNMIKELKDNSSNLNDTGEKNLFDE